VLAGLLGQSTYVINPRQVANHQSDVATRCFRDGFPPLATACVNQDAVPSARSTRAVARPMPSVDPVMPMTAMIVILPRPADRREPGSPTLDFVCRERTGPRNGPPCTGDAMPPLIYGRDHLPQTLIPCASSEVKRSL